MGEDTVFLTGHGQRPAVTIRFSARPPPSWHTNVILFRKTGNAARDIRQGGLFFLPEGPGCLFQGRRPLWLAGGQHEPGTAGTHCLRPAFALLCNVSLPFPRPVLPREPALRRSLATDAPEPHQTSEALLSVPLSKTGGGQFPPANAIQSPHMLPLPGHASMRRGNRLSVLMPSSRTGAPGASPACREKPAAGQSSDSRTNLPVQELSNTKRVLTL